MTTHNQQVLQQFDPQAGVYLTSAVHAAGPDLAHARQLVAGVLPPRAVALDAGCGAGHLSFALAPALQHVTATDPSPAMLSVVQEAAAARCLSNISTRLAHVEALPFEDGQFCLVASRYSAHHWRDVPAALREMRRVVKPGGYLLMIDLLGDQSPLIDTHLQAIELLRDPSHVRDYTLAEWRGLMREAGFTLQTEEQWTIRLEFNSWVKRMRTPPDIIAAIRTLQRGAPEEARRGLVLEDDGSFSPRVGMFWARAGD